jgi:hypothetical protein
MHWPPLTLARVSEANDDRKSASEKSRYRAGLRHQRYVYEHRPIACNDNCLSVRSIERISSGNSKEFIPGCRIEEVRICRTIHPSEDRYVSVQARTNS